MQSNNLVLFKYAMKSLFCTSHSAGEINTLAQGLCVNEPQLCRDERFYMSACSPLLKFSVEPFVQGSLKFKFINVSNMGILFHPSLFALRCDHVRVDVYWMFTPYQSDVYGVLTGLMSVLCRLGYSP